jgi:alkylation response protein AidB-like acyl-CoA dehydrogenase
MIGSDGGYYSAALDDDVGRTLYNDLDSVTAGWIFPGGHLTVVDGGFKLSGRWQFGSGCTHADIILGGGIVYDGVRPVIGNDGTAEVRVAMLPAERFQVLDTWHTTGLAGSGSHDYKISGAFVPFEQTFHVGDSRREGALYAWPGLVYVSLAGVPLGIARDALDAAEILLSQKVLTMEMRPARDDARVRSLVARSEALVGSARSYAFDVVGNFWTTLLAGAEPSHRQRAALAGCYRHVLQACLEAVQLLGEAVGSASIYRTCPIERHLRDLMTIGQHIVHQQRFLEAAGGLWMPGADENNPLLAARIV